MQNTGWAGGAIAPWPGGLAGPYLAMETLNTFVLAETHQYVHWPHAPTSAYLTGTGHSQRKNQWGLLNTTMLI